MSGRWLQIPRPLPYAEQQRGTGLDTAWLNTPIADGLKARNRAEEVRLLYVGLTRARDYLVLTARLKSGILEVDALDLLVDGQGQRVITLPIAAGQQLKAGAVAFDVTFRTAQPGMAVHRTSNVQHIAPKAEPVTHPPLRLRPSAAFEIAAPPPFNEIRISDRIPLTGRPDIESSATLSTRSLPPTTARATTMPALPWQRAVSRIGVSAAQWTRLRSSRRQPNCGLGFRPAGQEPRCTAKSRLRDVLVFRG